MTPVHLVWDHDDVVRRNALEAYLLKELDGADRDAFEAHLFVCAACAEEMLFFEGLREALRDDPELGARFHTEHAAAGYVLRDLSPENQQKFEIHMQTCGRCARNVKLGEMLLKNLLEPPNGSAHGNRLLSAMRFVRWFALVFSD